MMHWRFLEGHRVKWVTLCLAWVLSMVGASAQAQAVIYRCGQEYTNAPRSTAQCEPLSTQAIMVVPGTQPSGTALAARRPVVPDVAPVQPERTKSEPVRAVPPEQAERDAQARTLVVQELEKARQQLHQLTQEYNEGEPVKWAAEARNHQKYLDRVASLKAAMARTERDIDSLQRELARRPLLARTTTP